MGGFGDTVPTPVQPQAIPPLELGKGATPVFGVQTIPLATAQGTPKEFPFGGDFLMQIGELGVNVANSNPTVDVRLQDQINAPIQFTPGVSIDGIPFDKVYLSWAAQASIKATFLYVRGAVRPFKLTIPWAMSAMAFRPPGTFNDRAHVSVSTTATLVIDSQAALQTYDTNRVCLISNLAVNTEAIYLGFANSITTSRGVELTPGNTIALETIHQIWGIRATATESVGVGYTWSYLSDARRKSPFGP